MVDQIQSVAPQYDDAICVCGRPTAKPHCPFCGSAQILCSRKKRDYITRPDGEEVELRVYACRVCGSSFNDDHRSMCGAPPPRNGQHRQNVPFAPQTVAPRKANVPDFTSQPDALREALAKITKKWGGGEQ